MVKGIKDYSPGGHSKAKVELYRKYLAVYLNILSRVEWVKKIFIFDLFAGEGIYPSGQKGSPIVALEAIKNHCYSNNKKIKDIEIWLNDKEESEIDRGFSKISRVKDLAKAIELPENVNVVYSQQDAKERLDQAIAAFSKERNSVALFFIDPFGYKDIAPEDINRVMELRNTELLLFLPVSFMYRFAQKSMAEDFPGSEPLRSFLNEVFVEGVPKFGTTNEFLKALKKQFVHFLSGLEVYVDAFVLDGRKNTFALFFFTRSKTGFARMVDTKWKLDPDFGEGYKPDQSPSFFGAYELSNFPQMLYDYLDQGKRRTNEELLLFGLINGFKPTHVNQAIKELGKKVTRIALDGKPNKGNYISDRTDRRMLFATKRDEDVS